MALCRCKEHPAKRTYYTHYVEPIGYPKTSSICGIANNKKTCSNPGLIWLKEDEVQAFNNNVRIFTYDHNCSKVEVNNSLKER